MKPENEIKKRFLALATAMLFTFIAIFVGLDVKNACAYYKEPYRPSYVWATVKTSNTATNIMDALLYNAAFFGQIGKDLAHSRVLAREGKIELQVYDRSGFWREDGISPFTTKTVKIDDLETLRDIGNKNIAYFEEHHKDLTDIYIRNPDELRDDLTRARRYELEQDPIYEAGVRSWRRVHIPDQLAGWKAFTENVDTIFDKTQESLIEYKRDYTRELNSIPRFDESFIRRLNSSDNDFYRDKYQSTQFRIHDPIATAFETQSVALQPHMDSLRSLETELMMDAHTPFLSRGTFDPFQALDLSNYQDTLNEMEFRQLHYLDSLKLQQTTMDHIRSMEARLEPIQSPSFDDYRNMINSVEFDQLKYIFSLDSERTAMDYIRSKQAMWDTIKAPDWSQLQNMKTMDAQQYNDYLDTMNRIESQYLRDLGNLRDIEIPTSIDHLEPIRIQPKLMEPIRMPDY